MPAGGTLIKKSMGIDIPSHVRRRISQDFPKVKDAMILEANILLMDLDLIGVASILKEDKASVRTAMEADNWSQIQIHHRPGKSVSVKSGIILHLIRRAILTVTPTIHDQELSSLKEVIVQLDLLLRRSNFTQTKRRILIYDLLAIRGLGGWPQAPNESPSEAAKIKHARIAHYLK